MLKIKKKLSRYFFPQNQNVYVGEFRDGAFHGEGTIYFHGLGKYEAQWDQGVAHDGTYSFKDGLEYSQPKEKWAYCTAEDRRFLTEHMNGLQPAGQSQIVDNMPPRAIPKGAYDTGDGYFNADLGLLYTYDDQFLRAPGLDELEWIPVHCRRGGAAAPASKDAQTRQAHGNHNNHPHGGSHPNNPNNSNNAANNAINNVNNNNRGLTREERERQSQREQLEKEQKQNAQREADREARSNIARGLFQPPAPAPIGPDGKRLQRNVRHPKESRATDPRSCMLLLEQSAKAHDGPVYLGLFKDNEHGVAVAGLLCALQAAVLASRGDLRKTLVSQMQAICAEYGISPDHIPRHVAKGDAVRIESFIPDAAMERCGGLATEILKSLSPLPMLPITGRNIAEISLAGNRARAVVDGRVVGFTRGKLGCWGLDPDLSFLALWNPAGNATDQK